ncbi:hypothetical protein [Streptomyces sp. ALI-76-A]|nr:hypothetical protein [Streptomyces sp. ALI-76-A]MDL5198617.1 hypothetical protein [Streptomyces sp. ALI-76-A]
MSTHAGLGRWPTAPIRTELIHGVPLFAGDFDETPPRSTPTRAAASR